MSTTPLARSGFVVEKEDVHAHLLDENGKPASNKGLIQRIEENAGQGYAGTLTKEQFDTWLNDNVWNAKSSGDGPKYAGLGPQFCVDLEEVERQWQLIDTYKKDPRSRWFWIGWWRKSFVASIVWKIQDWWNDEFVPKLKGGDSDA